MTPTVTEEMIEAGLDAFYQGTTAAPEAARRIVARILTAALSLQPNAVKVRELVWDEPKKPDLYCSYDYTKANGAGLIYQIEWKSWKDYPGYCVYAGENMVGTFDTLEAAKSAAQADYTARIMSALDVAEVKETPAPSQHVAGIRTVAELQMTAFADAAPQRDEFNGEQTILTYNDKVGVWDLEFFEGGEEFPEEWLGRTHWIDITRMWPGVIAQVASFATTEGPEG